MHKALESLYGAVREVREKGEKEPRKGWLLSIQGRAVHPHPVLPPCAPSLAPQLLPGPGGCLIARIWRAGRQLRGWRRWRRQGPWSTPSSREGRKEELNSPAF